MTIKKPVKATEKAAEDKFIKGAPDAAAKAVGSTATGVIRGNKRVITVGIALDLMPRLDAAADRLHVSRAAFINMALTRAIEQAEP
jgi:hypothetical protein